MVNRAAVLGKPITHSLSPVLHNAAYQALGLLDWDYTRIECDRSQLAEVLASSPPSVVGYSATMPLKRRVLEVASGIAEPARLIGSGNTLLRTERGWYAENTDWVGIRDALTDAARGPFEKVLILGAGGTAQAALYALRQVPVVWVAVRNRSRTVELAETAQRLDRSIQLRDLNEPGLFDWPQLVISTLPAHVADQWANRTWRGDQTLLDVAYSPWPSRLATAVSAAGGSTISGLSMLLFQAASQVQLMTGQPAPIAQMRTALIDATGVDQL